MSFYAILKNVFSLSREFMRKNLPYQNNNVEIKTKRTDNNRTKADEDLLHDIYFNPTKVAAVVATVIAGISCSTGTEITLERSI